MVTQMGRGIRAAGVGESPLAPLVPGSSPLTGDDVEHQDRCRDEEEEGGGPGAAEGEDEHEHGAEHEPGGG